MGGTIVTTPAVRSVDAPAEPRRGMLVLSHPAVAALLAIWVLNDHVLKAHFGSWWTGKLTDVVAMAVFPLLVAAAVELIAAAVGRSISSPIAIGIGFTAVFFSAINLWAQAVVATEWLMSLVLASTLTLDPTDLVVLPALAGAHVLWHRPLQSWRSVRLVWGRLVFGAGLVACLATSDAGTFAAPQTGVFVLTDDAPTLSIPVSLFFDGEPAEDLEALLALYSATFFGSRAFYRDGVVLIDVAIVDAEDGTGTVTYTVIEPRAGPVELQWLITAQVFDDGGYFTGGGVQELVVEVDAPADVLGPTPLAAIDLAPDPLRMVRYWEVIVETENDAAMQLVLPSGVRLDGLSVATVDEAITLTPGFGVPIRPPDDCLERRCTFSIWVAQNRDAFKPVEAGGRELRLFAPEGADVIAIVEHVAAFASQTFTTQTVPLTSPATTLEGLLDVSVPQTLHAPSYFRITAEPVPSPDLLDVDPDDRVSVATRVNIGPDTWTYRAQQLSVCCHRLHVSVAAHSHSDSPPEVMASAKLTVDVWSLEPVDTIDVSFD